MRSAAPCFCKYGIICARMKLVPKQVHVWSHVRWPERDPHGTKLMVAFCLHFLSGFVFLFCFVLFFWLCWVLFAAHGLSLIVSAEYSLLRQAGFPWGGFSHCRAQYSLWCGLQQLWCIVLLALQHMESSCNRDQTSVPCIGRWILNHWTIREVHAFTFF